MQPRKHMIKNVRNATQFFYVKPDFNQLLLIDFWTLHRVI